MNTRQRVNTARSGTNYHENWRFRSRNTYGVSDSAKEDALFGKGKIGPFVSKLVTDAGIRVEGQRGGINLLRRIYVSTKVRAGLTQMERFELALSMKHSPLATLKYVRAFKNKTDDAAANNELPRNY